MKAKIQGKESDDWHRFCLDHPCMQMAQSCLKHVSLGQCLFLADSYPDLVSRFHVQVRLMGNFVPNARVPWLSDTDGALCFI